VRGVIARGDRLGGANFMMKSLPLIGQEEAISGEVAIVGVNAKNPSNWKPRNRRKTPVAPSIALGPSWGTIFRRL